VKILLIGGTGFLGSRLVQRLASDHQIALLHQGKTTVAFPPGIREIHGNRRELEKAKSEIHSFAPEIVLDIILSSRAQAVDLLKVCKGIAKRVVAISSCDVYQAYDVFLGGSSGIEPTPLTETSNLRKNLFLLKNSLKSMDPSVMPLWIDQDYEKIEVEQTIMHDANIQGTVLRLPMIYGPGDVQKRFSNIIEWQKDDRDVILDAQTANWMGPWGYVDNVIEAIYLGVTQEKAAGKIYHVADSSALSYSEIVQKIGAALGWKGKIQISQKEYLPTNLKSIFNVSTINAKQNLAIDITKISKELGYQRVVQESQAFYQTYHWLSRAG